MDPVIRKAFQAAREGQKFAFATVIESTPKGTPRKAGAKMVVCADGTIGGTIGGGRNEKAVIEACRQAMEEGRPRIETYDYFGKEGQSVCGGQIKVFIEPFIQTHQMIICGGGHIGLALSFLGKLLNFSVTVIDNRKEFVSRKRFPHVDRRLYGDYTSVLASLSLDPTCFIMIVTQGNEHDYECLESVITSKAAYIGVISSQAKKVKFFNRLKKKGLSEKVLKRVDIPAGLDIGAQTPAEIAVSIAGEMIRQLRKNHLKTTKFLSKKFSVPGRSKSTSKKGG